MKRIFLAIITSIMYTCLYAQSGANGRCGIDLKWEFDGQTLTLTNTSTKKQLANMYDYNVDEPAPWQRKGLKIRKLYVGQGISNIGSYAFAGSKELSEVIFEGTDLREIGWGAFMDCSRLRTISLPVKLQAIETIAFANCVALNSLSIPDQCRVEDQAFASCSNLQIIAISPNAMLGHYVFAGEIEIDGNTRHTLYTGEIRRLPAYINSSNCHEFGLSKASVEKCIGSGGASAVNYDYFTSNVDTVIPEGIYTRNNTYALIIGNQNYRFVPDVPYAIHDARVFAQYCQKTLGIPSQNIHVCEDATKQMILEEELDWVKNIQDQENKSLIVYYAGHGVPDVSDQNKSYLLPTDVRGTRPRNGIALSDFYSILGDLAFSQTAVFLDACFSGMNRDDNSVNEGMRSVEVEAQDGAINNGSLVVFSAAQGNETAQGYSEQGHGLFTYYLLSELQSSGGAVSFGILSDNLKQNVSSQAVQLRLRKPQTPTTNASEAIATIWREMQF